jgi:hypothetical protein
MNDLNVIPESYEQWLDCITIRCGINLTDNYIQSRLTELRDAEHPKTVEFATKYGNQHLKQVIRWFERVGSE